MAYTKEESAMWEEKDRRIVCQNCLSHATQVIMGLGATGLEKFTVETIKQRIKETASDLVDWVYEKSTTKPTAVVDTNLPLPTPEQSSILETFKNKYGYSKEQVLTAYTRYPSNSNEAKECLTLLKKGN